jgi:hypothetical protein
VREIGRSGASGRAFEQLAWLSYPDDAVVAVIEVSRRLVPLVLSAVMRSLARQPKTHHGHRQASPDARSPAIPRTFH